MTRVLAIDPGYAGEGNACAYSEGDRIQVCWTEHLSKDGRRVTLRVPIPPLDHVVVELPQSRGENSAPLSTLLKLTQSGVGLALSYAALHGSRIHYITPSQWKGTEQKPIQHARMWEILEKNERRELGGDDTKKAIDAAVQKGALKRWAISGDKCYPPRLKSLTDKLDASALLCHFVGRLPKVG